MPHCTIVDSTAVLALLNRDDAFHKEAKLARRVLALRRIELCLPRIAHTEIVARFAREMNPVKKEIRKSTLSKLLDHLNEMNFAIAEHATADFVIAEQWCREYGDWPVGYADLCIAAIAKRIGADGLWTFDLKDLTPFVRSKLPHLDVFQHPKASPFK